MRREILFKAKRKNWRELPKEQWWVEGFYGYFNQNNTHCIYHQHKGHTIVSDIDETTLCQYTGLTDRNGKKVFENDIVEFLNHKGRIVFECGFH